MPKIRYIKNEFRFGITEYKTPCPFGMRDRYALQVYEVASRMCKDCPLTLWRMISLILS